MSDYLITPHGNAETENATTEIRNRDENALAWKTKARKLYTPCPEKKRPQFFLHNFNKCRRSFVIFGTNHPEDSFFLSK